jgi:hypothetical protein
MRHLEGSGTPVLYIGRTVLKGSLITCTVHIYNDKLQTLSLNNLCSFELTQQ